MDQESYFKLRRRGGELLVEQDPIRHLPRALVFHRTIWITGGCKLSPNKESHSKRLHLPEIQSSLHTISWGGGFVCLFSYCLPIGRVEDTGCESAIIKQRWWISLLLQGLKTIQDDLMLYDFKRKRPASNYKNCVGVKEFALWRITFLKLGANSIYLEK